MGRIRKGWVGPKTTIARLVPPIAPSKMWTTEKMYERFRLYITWDVLGEEVTKNLDTNPPA